MNHAEIIRRLKAPFLYEEVEAKIQVTTQDKTKGMAVFYLDARAVQERLDEVLGAFNWRNEYIKWNETSQICGLSIYNSEGGEWITKYDGADNSDIEPIKGGLTDAFKRSAVLWGVGRYLYQFEGVWVEIEQRGKGTYIKGNQMEYIKDEYDKAVARIFGVATDHGKGPASDANTLPSPQTPMVNHAPLTDADAAFEYRVQSVRPSGKESQLLELVSTDGEVVSAYIKRSDQEIKSGSKLQNVELVQKQSSYGQYSLINGYTIAA